MSLYQDAAGTIPALLPGDPVGLIARAAGTVNAVQATQASKPTLARHPKGGRRNLAVWTDQFTGSGWTGTTTVTPSSSRNFDGNPVVNIADTSTTIIQDRNHSIPGIGAGAHTVSLLVDKTTGKDMAFGMRLAWKPDAETATTHNGILINTNTGDILNYAPWNASTTVRNVVDSGDGYWVVSFTVTFAAAPYSVILQLFPAHYRNDGTAEGGTSSFTGDISVAALQVEAGTERTAYQKVASINEVSEVGVEDIWHLYNDGGDSIRVILPVGEYGVATVNSLGAMGHSTITSDGTTPINLLRAASGRQADVIIREGAFSPVEIQEITAYWEARYK